MIKREFLMRSATWHNFNANLLNCGMNIQSRKIQDKSLYWHKNNNTSSILTKQLCLLKITWPKKVHPYKIIYFGHAPSLSHKNLSSCTTPNSAKQLFRTLEFSNFSTFTQYMSAGHGHSTTGGIEYDNGGCVEKIKRRKSHIDAANQWAREMPINWCQCKE